MKTILTYPNDASHHYVDPDYSGITDVATTYTTSTVPTYNPVVITALGNTDFTSAKAFSHYKGVNVLVTKTHPKAGSLAVGDIIVWESQPSGSATFASAQGMYQRMGRFLDSSYKQFVSGTPSVSITTGMEQLSKWRHYLDNENGDDKVSLHSLHENPVSAHTMRLAGYTVDAVTTKISSGGFPVLALDVSSDNEHLFTDGDLTVAMTGFVDEGGYNLDRLNYVNTTALPYPGIDGDYVELHSNSSLTAAHTFTDLFAPLAGHLLDDNGTTRLFLTSGSQTLQFADGTAIIAGTQMANITGTVDPTSGSQLYLQRTTESDSNNEYLVYTDSGLTTGATLTSETNQTHTQVFRFESTGAKNIGTTNKFDISGDTDLETQLADSTAHFQDGDDYWGFCRVSQSEVGTATYSAGSGKTIPSSIDNTEWFTWFYDTSAGTVGIFDGWDESSAPGNAEVPGQEFTVGGTADSSNYVEITVEFIDMTDQKSSANSMKWGPYVNQSLTTTGKVGASNNLRQTLFTWYYVANNPVITSFGNREYSQRTGESTYVFNPEYNTSYYWLPGNSFATAPYAISTVTGISGYERYPDMRFNDSGDNKRLMTYSNFTEELQRGTFTQDTEKLFEIDKAADTYSVPAYTTSRSEDFFLTDDEFADGGFGDPFNNTQKRWPRQQDANYKAPRSINWRIEMPNAHTTSQSGKKYSKNSGRQITYLDVEYPPLTQEQFLPMMRFARAVQGGFNPFIFDLVRPDHAVSNHPDLWFPGSFYEDRTSVYEQSGGLKIMHDSNGERVITVEGWPSDKSNAISEGEAFILGGDYPDGQVKFAISETDANAFGEARFRINVPTNNQRMHNLVYLRPTELVVTLDDDDFQYTQTHNGLYLVSVSFRTDQYKGGD